MWRRAALLCGLAVLTGCVDLPAKYEVTDPASQRKFTTYENWGKQDKAGYAFYDLDSGERIVLKDYQRAVLSEGGLYSAASLEVVEYRSDRRKAGPDVAD